MAVIVEKVTGAVDIRRKVFREAVTRAGFRLEGWRLLNELVGRWANIDSERDAGRFELVGQRHVVAKQAISAVDRWKKSKSGMILCVALVDRTF